MRYLLRIVGGLIDLYNCSLAEDVNDLENEAAYPQFSNRRHAKIQVRGEKEILHHFALWARTALDVMGVIEREVAAFVVEKEGDGGIMGIGGVEGFESVTRAMEEEEDSDNEIHHTIVRYCSDVLGAIRREEMMKVRRSRSATDSFMDHQNNNG